MSLCHKRKQNLLPHRADQTFTGGTGARTYFHLHHRVLSFISQSRLSVAQIKCKVNELHVAVWGSSFGGFLGVQARNGSLWWMISLPLTLLTQNQKRRTHTPGWAGLLWSFKVQLSHPPLRDFSKHIIFTAQFGRIELLLWQVINGLMHDGCLKHSSQHCSMLDMKFPPSHSCSWH